MMSKMSSSMLDNCSSCDDPPPVLFAFSLLLLILVLVRDRRSCQAYNIFLLVVLAFLN
jgi:hypothetical protein